MKNSSKFSFQQQILLGFSISVILVIGVGVISYNSIQKLREDVEWVQHTQKVINHNSKLLNAMIDCETAQRGYIITGNPHYLAPFKASVNSVLPMVADLHEYTSDNPVQQANVDSLENALKRKLILLQEAIDIQDRLGYEEAKAKISTNMGLDAMSQIRERSQAIENEEKLLLTKREVRSKDSVLTAYAVILGGTLLILGIVFFLANYIRRTFLNQKAAEASLNESNTTLEALRKTDLERNWVLTGGDLLNEYIRGEITPQTLAQNAITFLCDYLKFEVGAVYFADEHYQHYTMAGAVAFHLDEHNRRTFRRGETLIGQAALDQKSKIIHELPTGYLLIKSGIGESAPNSLLVYPVVYNRKTIAVLELGMIGVIGELSIAFLDHIAENLAINIIAAEARVKLQELFERTQEQAEELESQQEELRQTNEELYHQAQLLQASEEELRVQQEELRQTNQELQSKAQELEDRNEAIEQAREAISLKASELTEISKYKSEFLANMSHELRTPLNSVLILAKLLSENKTGNLNDKQMEYALVIYRSGNDLLNLINDILDLSKIEAGKVEIFPEDIPLGEILTDMNALFGELANQKKIKYALVNNVGNITIRTDKQRLEQVLKNLLSNAFKFTHTKGEVSLTINEHDSLDGLKLAFVVKDTGIGISREKQMLIFEAFKQADGSTSRKFGGTGLGLSISRELAKLLGGEILLESEEEKGSTFTLVIPKQLQNITVIAQPVEEEPALIVPAIKLPQAKTPEAEEPEHTGGAAIADDHLKLEQNVPTILIVEDDMHFGQILVDFAHERGYQCIVASDGQTGFAYTEKYMPDAIILDMNLPVMDGWTVLRKLKEDARLKHIPVHVISGADREKAGLAMGAISYLKKPIQKQDLETTFDHISQFLHSGVKTLLIIEDDDSQQNAIINLIQAHEPQVNCITASSAVEAIKQLRNGQVDGIILDLGLHDKHGIQLLEDIRREDAFARIPVVVYTGQDLSREEERELHKFTNAIILKTAKSFERLINEVSLFIHQLEKSNPAPASRPHVKIPHRLEESLKGKKVLLVDDDMRNVFALSTVLEDQQMEIITASDGKEALAMIKENPDVDIVLMDIMMPEMDGYEATRQIRKMKKFQQLPILALTAKAMQGDREKCIEAGASDYISKPVNIDQLFSLMRVWLYR